MLLALFQGNVVSKENQERLEYLDKYLDIPLVQGFFHPKSYDAFHRLVENKCTRFPNYCLENPEPRPKLTETKEILYHGNIFGLPFCEEAAKHNHLDTLKKAYEMGFHWDNQVIKWAVHHKNIDMINYVIENHGDMSFNQIKEVIKSLCSPCEAPCESSYCHQRSVDILRMLMPFQEYVGFTFSCFKYATIANNIPMLQFMKDYMIKHEKEMRWKKYSEKHHETIHIGMYIESVETYEFYKDILPEPTDRFSDNYYDHVFLHAVKCNNIPLLKLVRTNRKFSKYYHSHAFGFDTISDELRIYLIESSKYNEENWNDFISQSLDHPSITQLVLQYRYLDKDGVITKTPTTRQCTISERTWSRIVSKGNIELSKQLGPIPLSSKLLKDAINHNQMEMVKYLVELQCPWPNGQSAASYNYYPILKYIHEQGYPCHDKSCHKYYHPKNIPFCPLIP